MPTRFRLALLLIAGALLPASSVQAQAAPASQAGPRLEQTAAGIRPVSSDADAAQLQARTNPQGKPIALMVVGGAAVVLGTLIGNDIGTLISIGGAVALLYGLYLYLR